MMKFGNNIAKASKFCPHCYREIKHIPYVEHGIKVWVTDHWEEDSWAGDIVFRCPEYDVRLDYSDLREMEVLH